MRNYTTFFGQLHDELTLRRQRGQKIRHRLFTGYRYIVWLILLIVSLISLWNTWPTIITGLPDHYGQWPLTTFLFVVAYSMPRGMGSIYLTMFRVLTPSVANSTLSALRGAILARDAEVAPLVDVAISDAFVGDAAREDNPQRIETLAPLAHPLGAFGLPGFVYLLGVLVGCTIIWFAAYFGKGGNPNTGPYWEQLGTLVTAPVIIGSIGLLIVTGTGSAWLWRRRERRGLVVQVDALGVIAQTRGRQPTSQRLEWADVRGFALMRFRDDISQIHTTYLICTADRDLLWDMPPVVRYGKPAAIARRQAECDAARRLAQIVEQRTGLQALDMSDIMHVIQMTASDGSASGGTSFFDVALSIARAAGDEEAARAIWQGIHPGEGDAPASEVSKTKSAGLYMSFTPEQRADIVRYARALLPHYPKPEEPIAPVTEQRRAERGHIMKWQERVVFSLGIFYLVAFGLNYASTNWYAPAMLRALPTQTVAQTPLYDTAFNGPQAGWPTRAASSADTRSVRFTSSGYELSATDPNQTNAVRLPLSTPSDSAVEMTIRLTSAQSNAGAAGGGLLLNVSPDGSRALGFIINQYGSVTLNTCHDMNSPQGACDRMLFDSYSQSPHPYDGAANTLLTIHRGQTYFFYLNDAPVFVYRDTIGEAGTSGYVGAFLDQGGGKAEITQLTIYPAPATLPFWAR
ncbi:MAG TPA: hypothetical protein VF792_05605 [Ktedonobacterales bacterium]